MQLRNITEYIQNEKSDAVSSTVVYIGLSNMKWQRCEKCENDCSHFKVFWSVTWTLREETLRIPYGLKLRGDCSLPSGISTPATRAHNIWLVYLESIYRTFLNKREWVTTYSHRISQTFKHGHSIYRKDQLPRLTDNSRLYSTTFTVIPSIYPLMFVLPHALRLRALT
jgi:hypothetical protein